MTECRIGVTEGQSALDPLRIGSDKSNFAPPRIIPKQIERAACPDDGIMHDHRGDDIFELSIGVRAQNRDDQPNIVPIVFTGGHGRNRNIFDPGSHMLRQRDDSRRKEHEDNGNEATQACHEIPGERY